MDMPGRLLERIRAQLSVMTRSQQLAIGLCAAIIMGSLLWLMQWSTEPELKPLLDQPMTLQEMGAAIEALRAEGAQFEEVGDRIFVKPQERRRLQRRLLELDALPKDTSLGFVNLLQEQSPFQPESVNKRNFLIALQNELAAVITADGSVAEAKVFINDASQRKLGARASVVPTASVNISTARGRQIDQAVVFGVANLVSGAVAGLTPHNVKVTVNNRPRKIPGPQDEISFGLLEEKKKNEAHLEQKIRDQLAYIPGVKVAVAVELETTRKHIELRDYTDADPKSEKSTTEESTFGAPSAESGVSPNTGTALTGAAEGQSTTKEETNTEYFPRDVAKVERWEQVPLTVKNVTASINIPRSYFVNVYMAQNASANSPSDDDLKVLVDIEKSRVRGAVQNVIGADDESAVQVDWFPDLAPDAPGVFADFPMYAGLDGRGEDRGVAKLTGYAPQLMLGGLAVFSLLLMVMLVRKSSRAINALPADIEQQAKQEEYKPLDSADVTEGYLMGQEVDEETIRYRNLSEQVSKMVDEDPETAAELVRRWMGQA